MQELHLVGLTEDRRSLIFSATRGATSGGYVLPVDDALVAVIDDAASQEPSRADALDSDPAEPARPPRPAAQLSVREVQARLRAGDAPAAIARDAGVDTEWVDRFAPPVRAEQRRVVDRALTLSFERPRNGASAVPLRRAIASAMAERAIGFSAEDFENAWTARLVDGERWQVGFTFPMRGKDRTLWWDLDLETDELTTSDRFASQLAYVDDERDLPPVDATVGAEARTVRGLAAPQRRVSGGLARPGSTRAPGAAPPTVGGPVDRSPTPTPPPTPARRDHATGWDRSGIAERPGAQPSTPAPIAPVGAAGNGHGGGAQRERPSSSSARPPAHGGPQGPRSVPPFDPTASPAGAAPRRDRDRGSSDAPVAPAAATTARGPIPDRRGATTPRPRPAADPGRRPPPRVEQRRDAGREDPRPRRSPLPADDRWPEPGESEGVRILGPRPTATPGVEHIEPPAHPVDATDDRADALASSDDVAETRDDVDPTSPEPAARPPRRAPILLDDVDDGDAQVRRGEVIPLSTRPVAAMGAVDRPRARPGVDDDESVTLLVTDTATNRAVVTDDIAESDVADSDDHIVADDDYFDDDVDDGHYDDDLADDFADDHDDVDDQYDDAALEDDEFVDAGDDAFDDDEPAYDDEDIDDLVDERGDGDSDDGLDDDVEVSIGERYSSFEWPDRSGTRHGDEVGARFDGALSVSFADDKAPQGDGSDAPESDAPDAGDDARARQPAVHFGGGIARAGQVVGSSPPADTAPADARASQPGSDDDNEAGRGQKRPVRVRARGSGGRRRQLVAAPVEDSDDRDAPVERDRGVRALTPERSGTADVGDGPAADEEAEASDAAPRPRRRRREPLRAR